jgi:prolyl 4-hydroxylase
MHTLHIALTQVVDTETGEFKVDKVRTSSGAFLKRGQDDTIKQLEARIAEWTRLPVENGEPFHILRYQVCLLCCCCAAAKHIACG